MERNGGEKVNTGERGKGLCAHVRGEKVQVAGYGEGGGRRRGNLCMGKGEGARRRWGYQRETPASSRHREEERKDGRGGKKYKFRRVGVFTQEENWVFLATLWLQSEGEEDEKRKK